MFEDLWRHKKKTCFSINIEVNGEKQTAFQKTLISQGYTYKYILKLQKSQEKMLDKTYTPKLGWMCKGNSQTLQ